jgi:hypothetical protein
MVKKLSWLVCLWAASVAVTGLVALALHLVTPR